jgi:hypothetical protein
MTLTPVRYPMVSGFEFVFGAFKTYQVSLAAIESKTGLDFGRLKNFDPLGGRHERAGGGFEAAPVDSSPKRIQGVGDIML